MIDNTPATEFSKSRSFLLGSALLGFVLLLTAVAASLVVSKSHGASGVCAAFAAFAICWLSGSLALAITLITTDGPQAVSGMFLAMAVRTGLPLALGVTGSIVGGPLAEAGFFGLVLLHYLVGLLTETCLAVRIVSIHNRKVSVR